MSFLFRDARKNLIIIHHIKHGTGNTYYRFQGNKMMTPPVEFEITAELFNWKHSLMLSTPEKMMTTMTMTPS
jgi:hypothetical protein